MDGVGPLRYAEGMSDERDPTTEAMQARRARVRAAIDRASDEVGLEIWYRSCAEPLIALDDADFPSCCGANCEPCSLTLIEVALRARAMLAAESS